MIREQQDALYSEAYAAHEPTMRRIARAFEADTEKRRDLLQDIYLELWCSLASFDGRCSLRTWVYRVAHNVAASHVARNKRLASRLVYLETLETDPSWASLHSQDRQRCSADNLLDLVYRLKPLDRQVIVLHLEGESAASIGDVTGLSPGNVATKIHRTKKPLKELYLEGTCYAAK